MQFKVDDSQFKKFIRDVDNWARGGLIDDLSDTVDDITESIKSDLMDGKNASGKSMAPVKDSTMDMPVRFTNKRYLRRSVNPDKNKPIQATGKTIRQIRNRQAGNTFYIEPGSKEGDVILNNNKNNLNRDAFDISGDKYNSKIKKDVLKSFDRNIDG